MKKKAYIVDVNMGYGHSRAAHNLRDLGGGEVISANDYVGIPALDKRLWHQSRQAYEMISRLKPLPLVGDVLFGVMDYFQKIDPFYPRRDLSSPSLQVKQIYALIKRGLGKHLIETLAIDPKPFVTTFFIPAFFAEYYNYPGEIYAVTTDADISRAWAPLYPKTTRIKYFASNGRVKERLMLYGVSEENIFLTGFPLPKELIGGAASKVAISHLVERICRLDPRGLFVERYRPLIEAKFGKGACQAKHPLLPPAITYTVGGAGAQKQLGIQILHSLKPMLLAKTLRLYLVAGTRKEVVSFFLQAIKEAGLGSVLGKSVFVPTYRSRAEYFSEFHTLLGETDVLWTKPSEMSFYTALGLPVIMAPPIGSQEEFNRLWLTYMGGGMAQMDPHYAGEWLVDWINSGGLARMAWNGFVEAPTHGVYRIEDIILGRKRTLHELPHIV